jgi:hypothetical protein
MGVCARVVIFFSPTRLLETILEGTQIAVETSWEDERVIFSQFEKGAYIVVVAAAANLNMVGLLADSYRGCIYYLIILSNARIVGINGVAVAAEMVVIWYTLCSI